MNMKGNIIVKNVYTIQHILKTVNTKPLYAVINKMQK